MTEYKAQTTDMLFAMNDVLGYSSHYASLPSGADATPDIVHAVLNEYAKLCENVIAPINRHGDEEGCTWQEGQVKTPVGYKEAYEQYREGGWPSLSSSIEVGGQGLPASLSKIVCEMLVSASPGFALYTAGQSGAIETIAEYGSEQQRALYETKLVSGEWNATMCLTEPHCGTDLGLMKTKAEPQVDGMYKITGTKIFITGGEHDLTENIVHIVLARLPDAPQGTKGISLFIVPKFLSDNDGNLGQRNLVHCGSIEKKMGVKASATCVMNFDGATGFLLGTENEGLKAMFTFMNAARIATATQGVSHAEFGYQQSLNYAKERLQMRALSGVKNPSGPADPIIVHPDVRRMLLTQKAFSEGNRLLNYYLAKQLDIAIESNSETERLAAKTRLDLLTPIAKAFSTETGYESANLAMQCFGGHGYIREWGVEQNVRDARIAMLYEGTTGIQALDLLGRKVLANNAHSLIAYTNELRAYWSSVNLPESLQPQLNKLLNYIDTWLGATHSIGERAKQNMEEVGAASVNYLMLSGHILLAHFWLQSAFVAINKQKENVEKKDFYLAKIETARFYFDHLLPRCEGYLASINAGADSMMSITEAQLAAW